MRKKNIQACPNTVDKKERILGYIIEHPGCKIKDISDDLEFARNTVIYHKNLLSKEESIYIRRSGNRYKIYPFGKKMEYPDLSMTEIEILLLIKGSKSKLFESDIEKVMRFSQSTVSRSLSNLYDKGYIGRLKDSISKRDLYFCDE
jgi:predicted transcriptional regulator